MKLVDIKDYQDNGSTPEQLLNTTLEEMKKNPADIAIVITATKDGHFRMSTCKLNNWEVMGVLEMIKGIFMENL